MKFRAKGLKIKNDKLLILIRLVLFFPIAGLTDRTSRSQGKSLFSCRSNILRQASNTISPKYYGNSFVKQNWKG